MKESITRVLVWRPKNKSLAKCLLMLWKPTAAALLAGMAFLPLYSRDIHFEEQDKEILITVLVPFLFVPFGVMIALVVDRVWKMYEACEDAVESNDLRTFVRYRDKRIHPMIHLLLGSMSALIQGAMMLLPYHSVLSGAASSSASAFVMTLYWSVATELDNPTKGIWFIESAPMKWRTMTLEELSENLGEVPAAPTLVKVAK